ncbi:MAG: site-2 protease family protein [Sedimentisphaerales bacterium]|nr:site-2 protease family protein [Sedimentisphaerales bacterium]
MSKKNMQGIFWVIVFAAVIYLVFRNISIFSNILVVLLGFGAVVLAHEFGHFIVAKLSGIKVEAFSIFMPPVLLGVRRTENGLQFRILPKLFQKETDEPGEADGEVSLPADRNRHAGETEYRIGLIPFGGFVKMLGQDDTGPVKTGDDPRSFSNKPIKTRIAVIVAGVVFNVISAVIIFMTVFLVGIKLPPAVVGAVVPNSPAAEAGLLAGDEVIEIAGKSEDLDFSNILVAAALSHVDEAVTLKVKHRNGSKEQFAIIAKKLPGEQMRAFGIELPLDLTMSEVSDANILLETTGLIPGDRITRVAGKEVQNYWDMADIVRNTLDPTVAVEVQRNGNLIEKELKLNWTSAENYEVKSESGLSHICYMVPRLRITSVIKLPGKGEIKSLPDKIKNKFSFLLGKEKTNQNDANENPALKSGDIIVSIGDIEYPNYKQMRDIVEEHEDKELQLKVLRADVNGGEEPVTVTVVPRRPPGLDRVFIGVGLALDAEHPIVAQTINTEDGPAKLANLSGATITAVNGTTVSSFYDVVKIIRQLPDEHVTIDYLKGEKADSVTINADKEHITVKSTFAEIIPFKHLERAYKAGNPINAIEMGARRTVMFVEQAYVTLSRLIGGSVSPKNLMGPVGIMTLSYRVVAEQPLINYVYFLGLISAVIAVFNLLPLPPLDGGLILLMLIERFKGTSISERTQGIIAYAGWILIGTLLLYVTFNDIVRSFFS